VGPSYVVVSAVVVALAVRRQPPSQAPRRQPPSQAPRRQPPSQQSGGWLVRALAAVDLVILVFPGNILGGLSQLDVAAVGHLAAMLTGAVASALILRRRHRSLPSLPADAEAPRALPAGISPHPPPPGDQAAT
jgi:membrane associated rhomboid family serine protease